VKEGVMEDRKRIGWFCSYVPEELLVAAGLVPIRLKGQVKELKEADSYIFSNICPYLKNIFDSGLRGTLDHLDGIIFTNSCDGMRKVYDLWIEYIQTPFTFMLEVPKNRNSSGIKYFSHQLYSLKKNLEEFYDVDISQTLPEAISHMNTQRTMIGDIYERQKESPPNCKGSELYALCEEEMTSPTDRLNPILEEFTNRLRSPYGSNTNNARILITGNRLDNPILIDLVENAHGLVVMFDTCNGFKHYADLVEEGSDPIECLARRYLLKPTCTRMPGFVERIEHLEQLIQDYSIDGVIYSNLKYCDYSLFEIPYIESYLKRRDVPMLVLENDYLFTDVERLKIRVEAFMEMVSEEVS
jgi:benzoyl-CoA reductase/2-hydroxyglutaryl-CoA dehydratase subunit BcrC/BadD/HgdB